MTEAISSSSNDYYLPDNNETIKAQQGLTDPEAFLKILVAQMKYQNPMEPQDSSEFINQLTQMASMEQMYNMSQSMDKMAAEYEMARYFQIIGQQVTLVDGDEIITDRVGGIAINDNQPTFYFAGAFDGEQYTLDQVINITSNTNNNSLLAYMALVGQQVTIIDNDSEISGVIEKVFLQNGNVSVRVNGSDYNVDQITELHVPAAETNNQDNSKTGEEITTVLDIESKTTE